MIVGNVHLIAGDASVVPQILALLKEEGIEASGNPDVYVRIYPQFGIDESRALRDRAALGAIAGSRRVFVSVAPTMTTDAQNALLKTLEEPPANAMFFFVVPSPQTLLPTLRSRAQVLRINADVRATLVDAEKFIAAVPAKRLEMLKPLLEKDDNDRRDLGAILSFLASLERHIAKNPEGLKAFYRARKYVGDRGALVKPLLEQMALLLPSIP